MTDELKPCPFCGAELKAPTAVQYPKMGLARLHPGALDDGSCPIAGWGFYNEQLAAWNTRADDARIAALQQRVRELEEALGEIARAEAIAEVVAWLRVQQHGRTSDNYPGYYARQIEAKFGGSNETR